MTVEKLYSEKVMDHFFNPRNMGEMESPDATARVGNPVCGDVMEMYIKVGTRKLSHSPAPGAAAEEAPGASPATAREASVEKYIEDIKFKTLGCGAAIATSSIATEMIKGKSLEEAEKITNKAVTEALGGLPSAKTHCSVLATDAVKKAIDKYKESNQ